MSKKSHLPSKILVVDGDGAITNTVTSICAKHQIDVTAAQTWQNALYHFNNARYETCLVELDLSEMKGPTLLQKWRHHEIESKRGSGFILMLGKPQTAAHNALAHEIGDTIFMQKPIKEPILLSLLAKIYALKRQAEKIEEIKDKLITPLLEKGDVESLKTLATGKLKQMGVRGKELAAKVLCDVKEIEKAIFAYKDLHTQLPSNMFYVNEIGRLELSQGNLDKAKEAYEKADKIAPENVSRLKEMARMYLMLEEPKKGVDKYEEILAIDPDEPEKKYDMFEELQSFGYDKHAMELCRKTTAPLELIRYYNNKGVLLSKSQDFSGAISQYETAKKLIPSAKELYLILFNEAIAHMNLKDEKHMEKAFQLLTQCVKMKPDYEKAREKMKLLEKRGYPKAG